MITFIKRDYAKIKDKKKFIEAVAGYFHMSPLSVRNHWFSNHWAIPEKKQERCHLYIEHWLVKEAKVANEQ